MAFLFDDSNTEYMFLFHAIASSPPFSMACFANTDETIGQTVMSIANHNSDVNYHRLVLCSTASDNKIAADTRTSSGNSYSLTTTGFLINTWHHVCGVWEGADDRRSYIDGGSKGTNSEGRSPSGLDRTGVGVLIRSTKSGYMSGFIAEAAIWAVALTDAEVAILAAGYSPLFVRPESLLVYWPMVRKLGTGQGIELIQRKQLLVGIEPDNGPHCPIIYPAALQLASLRPPLAVIMENYKKMRVA